MERINKIPTINIDSRLKVGDTIGKHQYLAVITFNAQNYEDMCEVISEINRSVSYKSGENDMVIRYTDFETLKQMSNSV